MTTRVNEIIRNKLNELVQDKPASTVLTIPETKAEAARINPVEIIN
jgi:hypothetical protein